MEITELIYIFASVLIVSLISLIGIVSMIFSKNHKDNIILFLVSFSVGALLGDVFIHMIPEVNNEYGFELKTGLYILLGIMVFFILEKFIHWKHCHLSGECELHGDHVHVVKRNPDSLILMNLVGSGFHNFIDGIIIGASYLLSIPIGIATTTAIILHEVPKELGEFGILMHAGLSRMKALLLNFLTAILALFGAALAIIAQRYIENINSILIPLAAGGFIYIAGTDLIPELHKQNTTKMSIIQLIGIIGGIGIMSLMLIFG